MEEGAQQITEMRVAGLGDKPIWRLSAAIRERVERGETVIIRQPRELMDEYRLGAGASVVRSVFLSHAASDRDAATILREQLVASRPDMRVFVASRPEDIRADEDWLPVIQREIRNADAYCVLLTPSSNNRPWVWFETGAAWMSGKKWVIARLALTAEEVPLSMSIRQSYSLEDPEGAREIFRALGAGITNIDRFVSTIEAVRAGSNF